MKHLLQLAVPAVVLMHCAVAAVAQTYPSKPVTIICPNAPGGPLDSESRVYAQKLQEVTGQPFVLDYKAGAGGRIGITYVTKAAPDGYTVLIVGAALFGIGWGLGGLCPGPGIVTAASGSITGIVFLVAMVAGMYAQHRARNA